MGEATSKPIVSYLKFSSRTVGRLYPILLDKHGNIIDGMHRLTADKNWPKIRLEGIETEEQHLIARLISNVCRRHVPANEKTEILAKLGEIYVSEGVEPGKIAYKIAEKTGMSYQWVAKYLPDTFKDDVKSESARALRCRAEEEPKHEEPKEIVELAAHPEKLVLTVKNYANTHFVNIIVEKPFYARFEEIAEKLKAAPEVLINNALLLILKKLEEKVEKKNVKTNQA